MSTTNFSGKSGFNFKHLIIALIIVVAVLILFFTPREERERRAPVLAGFEAPDFELLEISIGEESSGKIWRLSELKGKVVFINFWATWCRECTYEKPYQQRLYEKMQGRPFTMLTILYWDEVKRAVEFMKMNGYTMPVLYDGDIEVARKYGIRGVPETFIIGKDGIVKKKVIGSKQWDSPEIVGLIEKWLQ
ncbi:MAG TPA: thioredoxin [Nitrospiraceae bacterium]|nr:thioredoxin [Nitrospiraceae bacterium]